MWQRVKTKKTPFYALVMNDRKLGRIYAEQLMEKIHRLQPKLDKLDKLADTDNLWSAERSTVAMGEPDPPIEIWHLLEYDYIAPWMTAKEREEVRKIIARITEHRYTNFMVVPDHFMINNHQGFGMEYIRLMLLIEGEKDSTTICLTVLLKKPLPCWITFWMKTGCVMKQSKDG